MPLLVNAVVAWIAGLFTAQQFTLSPIMLAAISAVVFASAAVVGRRDKGLRFRYQLPLLVMSVYTAGLFVGIIDKRVQQQCRAKLADPQTPIEVALNERAAPRAMVRGEARGTGALESCSAHAFIKVVEGNAPPGNIAGFKGKRSLSDLGLRLDGEIIMGTHSATLRAWRGNAGEDLDKLFGERAPLARALLIADQSGIAPDIRDRFADAGLVHMLSISGLHVALIASALTVLASAARLPRSASAIASLFVVGLYVLALGAPAPAVRSAVMLATVTIAERWQRPVHPWTALALGAVIPTWDARVVVDLGWQLSVAGMASLVGARAMFRRLRRSNLVAVNKSDPLYARAWQRAHNAVARRVRTLDGWKWMLAREIATGIIATVTTAPLIAWHFGRISLVAPVSNLAANPIVGVLQPALFLAMVLAPFPSIAKVAADACIVPLQLLDIVATYSARVPMAVLHVAPSLSSALLAGIAAAAVVRSTATRRSMPALIVAALAIAAAVWLPFASGGTGKLELHMIDVAQGDAIALRTPKGNWILVDAGRSWRGGDAGRRVVVPYVQRYGGRVVAFVLSHPHDDHAGGAASVINALSPERWWEPAYVGTSQTYHDALASIASRHIPWHRVQPHDTLAIDGIVLRVLAPDSTWTASQTDPNLASVVVRVEYGSVSWLLTGDAEIEEEEWLVHEWGSGLSANVLKVGHHGSRTSSSARFLDAVQPDVALISVGADNRYGHPSPETLDEFSRRGIQVLRTDLEGSIIARTNGRDVELETRSGRWTIFRASSSSAGAGK